VCGTHRASIAACNPADVDPPLFGRSQRSDPGNGTADRF
jgi:hypothetical protein